MPRTLDTQKGKSFHKVANQTGQNRNQRTQSLALTDRIVPILFKQNKRARRIIIRVDHSSAGVIVVLPTRATPDQGRRFALMNEGWILDRLERLTPPVPFAPGVDIPFLGAPHKLTASGTKRGLVWREDGKIWVAGEPAHFSRRTTDWLKTEARREIERRALQKSAAIDKKFQRIVIRDQKSRWGSCSPEGVLSFSWRLIFAPRFVLDYVVAHEVAHLKELNHGPRFWKLTQSLTPDMEEARAWLLEHGPKLQRYGIER